MDSRRLLVGFGTAITAFLVVAVLVIEIVRVDPGAGILGVLSGAVAGIATFVGVSLGLKNASGSLRMGLEAIAGFGYSVLAFGVLRYADVAGLRSIIGVRSVIVVSALVAVIVFLWSRFRETNASDSRRPL